MITKQQQKFNGASRVHNLLFFAMTENCSTGAMFKCHTMKKTIVLAVALLTAQSVLSQEHYYVDRLTGNDSNSGSALTSAWQTIQKACQAATPGSTVHILPGTYNENLLANNSGAAGHPIVFMGDIAGTVVIDGTGTNGNYLLRVKNASYLRFENLIFQNLIGNLSQGIVVETTGNQTSTDLTFKRCVIQNIRWTPIDGVNPAPTDNAHGLQVMGRNGGITNLTIEGCEISNNVVGYSEALTLSGNIDGFVITDCNIHDNTNIGIVISGHHGISNSNDEVRHGVISNNRCYNNISHHATSAGIYVDGGNSVTIERNVSYGNGYGIELGAEGDYITHSVMVKNNILYNNQGGGLEVGGYDEGNTGEVRDCIIRNNSLFRNNTFNDGVGEIHFTKTTNCVVENNILYTNDQQTLFSVADIQPQSGIILNHNCWYTPNGNPQNITVRWHDTIYTNYLEYKTALSQDMNSEFLDPGFEIALLDGPDLHLSAESPCINNGNSTTFVTSDEKDFDGNARVINSIIDMGAFESTSLLAVAKPNVATFQLAPNPAVSEVRLLLNEVTAGHLIVYDALGRIMLEREVSGRETIINLAGIPEGVYVAAVETADSKSVSRLMIRK